jgi:hypothetical protein
MRATIQHNENKATDGRVMALRVMANPVTGLAGPSFPAYLLRGICIRKTDAGHAYALFTWPTKTVCVTGSVEEVEDLVNRRRYQDVPRG